MTKLLLLLALAVIIVGWWIRRATFTPGLPSEHANASPDEQTLAALASAGADLTQPTEVNSYLYLPTEGHAQSAAQILRKEGYSTDVRPPLEGYTTWLCLATRQMVPRRDDIAAMSDRLGDIAREFGGEFDGWEAAVTN